MADPRIIILGAGPTGLGAGYRLQELGHSNFVLYDRNPYVGGLAHSFTDAQGFTWDIGGHVMFSHYKYYDQCFERLMGDEFTLNNRESWVRMMDRWVPYPFQNNVRYLPKQAAFECIAGLVRAQSGQGKVPAANAASNFGEFIDAVFGDGIARHFMRPYNYKVWAYPPERMNKHWIGERVAVIDVERAIRNIVLEHDDFGWGPNNQFKFPLRGGTGEFYKRFGPALGLHDESRPDSPANAASRVCLNMTVTSIDPDRREVRFADGSIDRYDQLISTMPLDILCTRMISAQNVPPGIREAASRLLHSSGYMVGIGLKSRAPGAGTPDTKSWMYFPESNCPFYRVTYLSNYSPFMTPDKDNYYSLLCETSESPAKPTVGRNGRDKDAMIEETIRGLENAGLLQPGERANIVSRWCYHADYSYPTPSVDRDDILAEVIPWLEDRGIHSRGRFGMWKYEVSNTDHSLMQGVECANRLVLGEPETTIGMVYRVTEDGRNAAVHERSAHAGSGEKRLAPGEPGARPATGPATGPGIRPADRPVPVADDGPVVEVKPEPTHAPSVHVQQRVGDIDAGDISEDEMGVTNR
jgi:protoporphyrinogen oxidase